MFGKFEEIVLLRQLHYFPKDFRPTAVGLPLFLGQKLLSPDTIKSMKCPFNNISLGIEKRQNLLDQLFVSGFSCPQIIIWLNP